jgi:hypothetical protein
MIENSNFDLAGSLFAQNLTEHNGPSRTPVLEQTKQINQME